MQFQCNQNPNPNKNLRFSGEKSRKNIKSDRVRNRNIKIKEHVLNLKTSKLGIEVR